MILTLLVVSALMTLGMAIASVSVSNSRRVSTSVSDRQAFLLAEAGIAEAIAARSVDGTGNIGSVDAPAYLDGGVLWVEATEINPTMTRLVANAMKDSGRASIEVVVGKQNLWSSFPGIASVEAPTIKTDLFMDSYDSRNGTYASQVASRGYANDGATLQTNGKLGLGSNSVIYGDVHCGPHAGLRFGSKSKVTGSVTPLASEFDLPSIDVPAIRVAGHKSVGGKQTLPPGDYGFESLTIEKGAEFTIAGPLEHRHHWRPHARASETDHRFAGRCGEHLPEWRLQHRDQGLDHDWR